MNLSIITINLNNKVGLKRTIDSVLSQTYSNYEWIVVDGGSTDGSKELIEQYSEHFSWWVSETDTGIYNAMNKGIAHAHGEWLQFLNSGDWYYEKNTLEKVFSKKYANDILFGDMILTDTKEYKQIKYPNTLTLSYFLDHTICHQATFYKKNIFIDNKYDESFKIVSDWAFQISLLLQGKTFEHINQYIVFFDKNGIGSQSSSKVFQERALMFEKYIPKHLKNDLTIVKEWQFVENRKSFRFLKKIFFCICKILDYPLHKIEINLKKTHINHS